MQSTTGIKKLEAIIEDVNKNGIIAENMVEQLNELREIAKVEQDPLVVKTLRLVYNYIEDEGHFDLNLLAEEEIEELEEEEEIIAEAGEEEEEEEEVNFETVEDFEERRENFIYFLNLFLDSQNEYNRVELRKIRTFLWDEIYG
jgi:hypothetical protein